MQHYLAFAFMVAWVVIGVWRTKTSEGPALGDNLKKFPKNLM